MTVVMLKWAFLVLRRWLLNGNYFLNKNGTVMIAEFFLIYSYTTNTTTYPSK